MQNLNLPFCLSPAAKSPVTSLAASAVASQGAGTLFAPVLTIDTRSLRYLFLPSALLEMSSAAYMKEARFKAVGKPRYSDLVIAGMAIDAERDRTIETVRNRGGLLLLVDKNRAAQ